MVMTTNCDEDDDDDYDSDDDDNDDGDDDDELINKNDIPANTPGLVASTYATARVEHERTCAPLY